MADLSASEHDLKTKLNRETSKISWEELQRHYASGAVVAVEQSLDLIEVACEFSRDNKEAVEQWLAAGLVYKPDDQRSLDWLEQQASLWAVVVAPWVLVQEPASAKTLNKKQLEH